MPADPPPATPGDDDLARLGRVLDDDWAVWHWDTDRAEYVCHYCERDDTHAGDCPWALARANLPALLTEVAALRAELARRDAGREEGS